MVWPNSARAARRPQVARNLAAGDGVPPPSSPRWARQARRPLDTGTPPRKRRQSSQYGPSLDPGSVQRADHGGDAAAAGTAGSPRSAPRRSPPPIRCSPKLACREAPQRHLPGPRRTTARARCAPAPPTPAAAPSAELTSTPTSVAAIGIEQLPRRTVASPEKRAASNATPKTSAAATLDGTRFVRKTMTNNAWSQARRHDGVECPAPASSPQAARGAPPWIHAPASAA